MIYKVEIANKEEFSDIKEKEIEKNLKDLGILEVKRIRVVRIYWLLGEGSLNENEIEKICENLLVDPITENYCINKSLLNEKQKGLQVVEIAYNLGVIEPIEESCKKGIKDLKIKQIKAIKTSFKYFIYGNISKKKLGWICEKILMNKVIQHIVLPGEKIFKEPSDYEFNLQKIEILNASNSSLLKISKKKQLFLNLKEMLQIQKYFKKLKRNPTDIELETLAQTWSEHCIHKTLRGIIAYNGKIIDNLLKTTIMKVTKDLNKSWCISVFKDNAGIISFDENYNICFKVETHNHPSALEPYGGAATGIGGVIRDSLGTGLGAKPIVNTNVFCFAPLDFPYKNLPKGTLHPKRIFKGVVAGVRDYGNRMGIPTSNGAILFNNQYIGNPLVYCGNVGIIPKDKCFKRVKSKDLILLIGGKTGRDGIHGATFSSGELTYKSEIISNSAVQIGNPIMEKKLTDALLQARDKKLYNAITDCGGGGLSSAIGELGKDTGVLVDLDKVPLKYHGLSYTEIWISEAQERMILAVSPQKLDQILKIFKAEDIEATIIGEFLDNQKLCLRYKNKIVADLEMKFLHTGFPRIKRKAKWKRKKFREPHFTERKNLTSILLKLLSHWDICSKEWVIRQYDHEVQGGSVLKPLQGKFNDGPGDACVTRPLLNKDKGIILSCGINSRYGLIDPYHMASSCIDEALRQIIAVGGNLKKIALLDNFSWGNTDKEDQLGGLVRAAQACYDIALVYETPFISGKDSLNNEYKMKNKTISIPPTLLISAISVIDDVKKVISMDLKNANDLVYIIGLSSDELGGSCYYDLYGFIGNKVPQVNPYLGKKIMNCLSIATERKLIKACHDCSDGGIAVACSEMSFAGDFGMELYLKNVILTKDSKIQRNEIILFSESNSRFIVEIEAKDQNEFEKIIKDIPFALIGKTLKEKEFRIYGINDNLIVQAKLKDLKEAWQKPLKD